MLQNFAPRLFRHVLPLAGGTGRRFYSKRIHIHNSPWRGNSFWPDFRIFTRDLSPPDAFRDKEDHFFRAIRRFERDMQPRFFDAYYVRPRADADATARSEVAQVKYDQSVFEVKVDVSHYTPEELTLDVVGNKLTLRGKHETKADEHGYVAREFCREFEIPEDIDPETFTSSVSEEGLLTIHADVKSIGNPEARTIHIQREEKKD